ncbi:MAG TPA: VOC family protein [Candidatus Sulfotelmatobacter sp.]|nr:VOC family protein [Candidatus Sulfotelmatobacter sp.]
MAPKIAGVVETSLYVEDLARSARFYAEVLGFERLDEDERITAMAVGSHQVLLLCKKGASKDWKVPHDGNGQLHLAFAIDRGQLEGWESRLAEHGIPIEHRKAWPRGGESIYFRDPDGHSLELETPGVWSVY